MSDLWGARVALAALVVPLALAGWLLGRGDRPRQHRNHLDSHGKMPR
jgi:hypothetical protein